MEAVGMLDELVDESDPDVDFPNSFHAFQTAEGIRKAHPDKGVPPPCPSPAVAGEALPACTLPKPVPPLPWPSAPPACPPCFSPPRLVPPRGAPARPGEGPGPGGGAPGEAGTEGTRRGRAGAPSLWARALARWAGLSRPPTAARLSPVGGRWRHLPGWLPSPGLCGFLRLHLPGQPRPPGPSIQVPLRPRRPPTPIPRGLLGPHPPPLPAARSWACTSRTVDLRTSSCPGATTVRPGRGSSRDRPPAAGPPLRVPGGDTLSLTEYMYQMMKFNNFSLPAEVGGGGPH